MDLSKQLTRVFNEMIKQDERVKACKNHTYKFIGFTYGLISSGGDVGLTKWYRCESCGDQMSRVIGECDIPDDKEMYKLYKTF